MKIKPYILLLFIALLFGCRPRPATEVPPAESSATPIISSAPSTEPTPSPVILTDEADPGLNLLIEVEGQVLLKRKNWSDFYPTAFGVALVRGDLLKLPGGAQAKILCDNLITWAAPSGAVPSGLNGCPRPEEPFLIRNGVRIASTRGGDSTVPYIITPRSTKLLNNTPTLRWNAAPGATRYTIQIRGGNLVWRQEGVTETSLIYPGAPALSPGVSYLLVVEADTGKSSQDEGSAGLGFSLLTAAEVEKIEQQRNHIAGLNLTDTAESYALAQYYSGQGLIAEAIQILEERVETGTQPAAIPHALANLYAQIGLWSLAELRYLQAAELAELENNLEARADIQANLGQIYIKLGKAQEASHWLSQAQANYEALGDREQAGDIAEQLRQLP